MPPHGFANFLDQASTELLRMEEQNRFPDGIRVHPEMYDLMAGVRRREIEDGYPLIVLGIPVEPDASLAAEEYRLTDPKQAASQSFISVVD